MRRKKKKTSSLTSCFHRRAAGKRVPVRSMLVRTGPRACGVGPLCWRKKANILVTIKVPREAHNSFSPFATSLSPPSLLARPPMFRFLVVLLAVVAALAGLAGAQVCGIRGWRGRRLRLACNCNHPHRGPPFPPRPGRTRRLWGDHAVAPAHCLREKDQRIACNKKANHPPSPQSPAPAPATKAAADGHDAHCTGTPPVPSYKCCTARGAHAYRWRAPSATLSCE
jgi:hypothetical protein